MAFSLYQATAANYLQLLGALSGVLEKGARHCADQGVDPATLADARLAPDMLPLRFQIVSVTHHSLGGLQAARNGRFEPPSDRRPHDYAALQGLVTEARDGIAALAPADVEAVLGRDVVFHIGGRDLPFVAEDFLMSFSLPNVYFHATTAYDILRHNGVPLGKRDFLGRMKLKA